MCNRYQSISPRTIHWLWWLYHSRTNNGLDQWRFIIFTLHCTASHLYVCRSQHITIHNIILLNTSKQFFSKLDIWVYRSCWLRIERVNDTLFLFHQGKACKHWHVGEQVLYCYICVWFQQDSLDHCLMLINADQHRAKINADQHRTKMYRATFWSCPFDWYWSTLISIWHWSREACFKQTQE